MGAKTATAFQSLIPADALPNTGHLSFDIAPNPSELSEIAAQIGLLGLRKVRFKGRVAPSRTDDWVLDAHLGATATQACVLTLKPVVTRLDQQVSRVFVADIPVGEEGSETEIFGDDRAEILGEAIDLGHILTESIALALPEYPRSDGAELAKSQFSAPGVAPMSDDDAKPFAGLSELRKKMTE